MASSLGNLNMSDMKWIGEPLDVVGQYQKGVNLAEQGQRMQQSADMHPLKMEDTKARTNLVKQQGEYNLRTMDSRVGLSDSMARLKQTAASISENTQLAQQDIIQARSMLDSVNAEVADATRGSAILAQRATNERAVTNQDINQQTAKWQVEKVGHETSLMASRNRIAIGTEEAQINSLLYQAQYQEEENTRWKTQGASVKFQLHALDKMTLQELDNYHIPSSITSKRRRAEIEQHRDALRGTERFRDHTAAQDALDSTTAARALAYTKAQAEMSASTFGILGLDHPTKYGEKLFVNSDGTRNQLGEVMLDNLIASEAALKGLSEVNKQKLIAGMKADPSARRGIRPAPGATETGKYGSTYNGDEAFVLDKDGIAKATEMKAEQARAVKQSEHMWRTTYNMGLKSIDGDGNWIYENNMILRADQQSNVKELILKRREEWITAAGLDENGNAKTIPTTVGRKIAVDSATEMGLGGMPIYMNHADAKANGARPGSTFLNSLTGIVSTMPKASRATTTPGEGEGEGGGEGEGTEEERVRAGLPHNARIVTLTGGQKEVRYFKPDTTEQTGLGYDAGGQADVMLGVGGFSVKEFNDLVADPNIYDSAMWEKRGEVFKKVYAKLQTVPHKFKSFKTSDGKTITSEALQRRFARHMTRMAIVSDYKTHSVSAQPLRDDYDPDSKTSRLFNQVREDFAVNKADMRNSLTEVMFGESYGFVNDAEQISWDNIAKLRAAIKSNPEGWYKNFNIKENPSGPDILGKIKSKATVDNREEIEKLMRSLDEYRYYIFALDAVKFGPNE